MKKKLLALVLAAGMVASMAACGNTNSSGSASAGNSKDILCDSRKHQTQTCLMLKTKVLWW